MFNIEKEIKRWRRALNKHSGFEDGHIEELENHLRDHIEDSCERGVSEDEAFRQAVNAIGTAELLDTDFKKSKMRGGLLGSYIRVAWRNLIRNRMYSVINISGLAVGFVCLIIIGLQVKWEYSYDKHYENRDRLYRIVDEQKRNGDVFKVASILLPLAPAAEKAIPEIEKTARLSEGNALFNTGSKKFNEPFFYVDPEFLSLHNCRIVNGSGDLKEVNSVILSETFAKKFFGKGDPVGKTITMNNEIPLRVVGVMADIPLNSHLRFHMLVSMKTYANVSYNTLERWDATRNDYTYVLLKPGSSVQAVEVGLNKVTRANMSATGAGGHNFKLQSIYDIHFGKVGHDNASTAPKEYVDIFGFVGILIMIIACINYVNLATARSAGRSKESGLRKVMGAGKSQLIRQFLTESVLTAFGGLFMAVAILVVLLPELQTAFRLKIGIEQLFELPVLISIVLIAFAVGVFSGFYPSFIVSSVSPVKNFRQDTRSRSIFRGVLVAGQFAVSVFLIIANIMVFRQVEFIKGRDPGFDSSNVMVVRTGKDNVRDKIEVFRDQLKRSPYVLGATVSSGTPASGNTSTRNYRPEGRDKDIYLRGLSVDYEFLKLYDIKLLNGRNFSKSMGADLNSACIINESAARKIGWKDSIGKTITLGGGSEKVTVIGVIKDFQYGSTKKSVWPSIYRLSERKSFVTVRFRSRDKEIIDKEVEKIYNMFKPEYPYNSYFIDVRMERYLRTENTIFKLLNTATIVALFISCLGIYGLISFTVEQKSREIGIRKVLGAPSATIFMQLLKGFGFWVGVANIVAFPLSYFVMNEWLRNYPYRVDIALWIFPLASLLSIIIAVSAAGWKASRAASANPVESLKCE